MRLSQRDRDIISRITLHADESLQMLARISKHQIHSVRYLLDRLKEANAIEKVWMIDPLYLGWQRYHLLFSLSLKPDQKKQKMIDYFKASPHVSSFSELGGDFDFQVNILARDVRELLSILRLATEQLGMLFFSKSLTLQHRLAYFSRKYFAKGEIKDKPMIIGDHCEQGMLSELDHKILCYLARYPDIQKKELAERTNVSGITLNAHFDALRKRKVIRGAIYALRGLIEGVQNYRLLVFARGIEFSLDKQMFAYANACPHCRSYAEGFGGAEYEFGIEVENYSQLTMVKEEICSRFAGKISQIIVLPRLQPHKFVTYPFSPGQKECYVVKKAT